MKSCALCHSCGGKLRLVLDGEEWCGQCQAYRRYRSHGFALDRKDPENASPCSPLRLEGV